MGGGDEPVNASTAKLLHKVDDKVHNICLELERKMNARAQDQVDSGNRDMMVQMEKKCRKTDEDVQKYY
jgi:hypothetical protein